MKPQPSPAPKAPTAYRCATCGNIANPAYGLDPPAAAVAVAFCRRHAPDSFFKMEMGR